MTASPAVPTLPALLGAERDAIDALLQFLGNRLDSAPSRQFIDSYNLQQMLLGLTDSGEQPLLAAIQTRLEALETLSPRQAAAIQLSDQLGERFFHSPVFDPALAAVLQTCRRQIAACALDGNGWLYHLQHPLRQVFNRLAILACGWHSGLGRSADNSRQFVQSLLSSLQLDWQPALAALDEWLSGEQQRVQKLEQRLLASETGAMKARRCRQLAIKTLNQLGAGKKLPPAAIEFLHGAWLQSLQLALIQGGERSELCFRQRKLTETLIWSLQPIRDDAHRQQLFRVIGQLGEELRDTLISLAHQNDARDEALAVIENLHLQLVQNQTPAYVDVPALDSGDLLNDSGASISRALLARVEALHCGQWFAFAPPAAQPRLKLLIKDDDSQQLLFVNQLGIKVLDASFEEFAYQLASGGAQPLRGENLFDDCWQNLLQSLHSDMCEAAEQAARIAAEQRMRIAEQRARDLARAKAEEEAAALLAAKAQAEQQRRAAEQAAKELAAEQQRAEQLAAQDADAAARQQRARLIASSLTIGAWLEARHDNGDSEKLKLAVILPSSGKAILVDRNGIKKLELNRDELVAALAENRLTLVNSGQQFEDTLARVVGGLRRDRNN